MVYGYVTLGGQMAHVRGMILGLVTLAACGGGGGGTDGDTDTAAASLTGLYQATAQYENLGSCEGRGDEVVAVPYVQIIEQADRLDVTFCPEVDKCPPTPDPDWGLSRVGADWEGTTVTSYVSEQDGWCVKILLRRTIKIEGDNITLVRKEFRQFDESISRDAACADAALAWDGKSEDQCVSATVEATRVP